jgi:hypothetical protein
LPTSSQFIHILLRTKKSLLKEQAKTCIKHPKGKESTALAGNTWQQKQNLYCNLSLNTPQSGEQRLMDDGTT